MRGCRRQQPAAERKLRPPGIKLVCDEARLASRLCPLLPSVSELSATITGFSAQLQRRRRGVSVKIFTWQAGVRATFTLKHVLRKLPECSAMRAVCTLIGCRRSLRDGDGG